MLDGKKLLITGVVTEDSIAFVTAQQALRLGAGVVLTTPPRDRDRAEPLARALDCDLLTLDVNDRAAWAEVEDTIRQRWNHLDGALHAVAFAPRDALDGAFLTASAESLTVAFHTSAASYARLAALLSALAPPTGGSLVGLDFDAGGAWPTYNWMGVCKAALEATSRYVARDLGPRVIRSNLVAAGPIHTRAAGGIPGFGLLLDAWARQAPIAWDPDDAGPVADAVCFLLSDLARAITGEVLHVDGGFHAMATALTPPGVVGVGADASAPTLLPMSAPAPDAAGVAIRPALAATAGAGR